MTEEVIQDQRKEELKSDNFVMRLKNFASLNPARPLRLLSLPTLYREGNCGYDMKNICEGEIWRVSGSLLPSQGNSRVRV